MKLSSQLSAIAVLAAVLVSSSLPACSGDESSDGGGGLGGASADRAGGSSDGGTNAGGTGGIGDGGGLNGGNGADTSAGGTPAESTCGMDAGMAGGSAELCWRDVEAAFASDCASCHNWASDYSSVVARIDETSRRIQLDPSDSESMPKGDSAWGQTDLVLQWIADGSQY